MDLWTLASVMIRRWRVVLAVMVVTIVVALLVATQTRPVGVTTGTWILVPENPEAVAAAQGGQAGSTEAQVRSEAGIISEIVQGAEVQQRLTQQGASTTYEVTVPETSPTLLVRAAAPDPAGAVATAQIVVDAITEEAAKRTINGQVIQATVLSPPGDQSGQPAPDAGGFTATASVLLEVGQPTQGQPRAVNPMILLGQTASNVLAEFTAAPGFAETVEERAAGTYEVTPDALAPIVRVRTTGEDEEASEATFNAVFETLQGELAQRQETSGAPRQTWLKVEMLVGPNTVDEAGQRLLPLLAIALLGVIAAVTLSLLVDGYAQRWWRERAPQGQRTAVHPQGDEQWSPPLFGKMDTPKPKPKPKPSPPPQPEPEWEQQPAEPADGQKASAPAGARAAGEGGEGESR